MALIISDLGSESANYSCMKLSDSWLTYECCMDSVPSLGNDYLINNVVNCICCFFPFLSMDTA